MHVLNSVDCAHVILKYINRTKIKGGCQLGRKVVTHDSKSDLPLLHTDNISGIFRFVSRIYLETDNQNLRQLPDQFSPSSGQFIAMCYLDAIFLRFQRLFCHT